MEDLSFLLERLGKTPSVLTNRYIWETLEIMKKLKLIKEFKTKIDVLEKQIQKEALRLIENTEQLMEEYSQCKQFADSLSEMLAGIEQPDKYQHFVA